MNEYSLILKIVVGVIIIILIFVAINTFLKSQKTELQKLQLKKPL